MTEELRGEAKYRAMIKAVAERNEKAHGQAVKDRAAADQRKMALRAKKPSSR